MFKLISSKKSSRIPVKGQQGFIVLERKDNLINFSIVFPHSATLPFVVDFLQYFLAVVGIVPLKYSAGTYLPLTPKILYLAVCGGKISFFPPLAWNDLGTLTGHKELIYV